MFRREGYNGRIMIGGVPVTLEFANAVGADGHADNAPGAAALAIRLVLE